MNDLFLRDPNMTERGSTPMEPVNKFKSASQSFSLRKRNYMLDRLWEKSSEHYNLLYKKHDRSGLKMLEDLEKHKRSWFTEFAKFEARTDIEPNPNPHNFLPKLMRFQRQGTLDGACVPYCAIMALEYLEVDRVKDPWPRIQQRQNSAVNKFLSELYGPKTTTQWRRGVKLNTLLKGLDSVFKNEISAEHITHPDFDTALQFVQDNINADVDNPTLLVYGDTAKTWSHCTVAVGFGEKERIIYVVDPYENCEYGQLFNNYLWKRRTLKDKIGWQSQIDWCVALSRRDS
ncbi:MAG: hypothetical protein V1724_02765 [Chloroflexota bacterium]